MGNALVVQVGMARTASFRTESEAARQDVDRLGGAVKQTSAELTAMQREARAAGEAVDAGLTTRIKTAQKELKGLQTELRTAKADYKILSEAVAAPLPMPKASAPRAAVSVAGAAEAAVEGVAGGGISRMGKMELGHVARSLAGSAAAGVPIGRSLEMEAPRLISALGPAVMSAVGGFGGLLAVLAPLTAAVAAGAAAFTLYNANQAAKKQRDQNDLTGNVFNRGGDTVDEVNKELEAAQKQERDTRKMRHSKLNHLANDAGLGLHDEDNENIRRRKVRIRDRRDDAMERDAGFSRREFDGDEGVEQDKLKVQLEEKIREIRASGAKDGNRLVEIAKEEYRTAVDTITRKQQAQASELSAERQLLSVRAHGKNVETESAAVRVRAAQEALKNGPAAGHEHDENENKLTAALLDQEHAKRNEASRAAAAAGEEKIVAIKRQGLDVDVKIAEERLKGAQAALDRSPAKSGVEYDALHAAASAAQLEVESAKKATGEKIAQLALETQIASLRGSSDQVHAATLSLDRAEIERRLKAAKPDEKAGMLVEQARNQQQRDEFAKSQNLRAIDTGEKQDKAHAGRGFEDQIRLLGEEMSRNDQRRGWNDRENGGDKDFAADLDLKAKELTQAIQDVIYAEQQRLTSLKNQDTQIRGRGLEATLPMKDRNVDAKYQTQIDEERHGKNDPAVIAQLQRNRADEHFEDAVDEEAMTPAQKAARTRANNRRQQASARVEARQRHHAENDAANHSNFENYFYGADRHTIGGHAQPNRRPGAAGAQPDRRVLPADAVHKTAADNGFKGSLGTVESLLSSIKENCTFQEQ